MLSLDDKVYKGRGENWFIKVAVEELGVLSRNKVTSTNKISSVKQQELMKKLNQKKIKWIIKEVDKRDMGVWTIAQIQDITKQHAYRVYRKYKNKSEPKLLNCGRKPKEISGEDRKIIIETFKEHPVGACNMELILKERGINMPHNKIHGIMREEKLAKEDLKKQRRRKWVRYERKHSLSLVHTDWFTHKGKEGIVFIDDASRFITGCEIFDNANTDNSLLVFSNSLKYGKPKQVMSDHGTQFVSVEAEGKTIGVSRFTEYLRELGIKHIKSRIKHPQSNGKAERVVGTMKQLWNYFGSIEKAVEYYNYRRPHMSLNNGKLRTPYQAFLDKTRK